MKKITLFITSVLMIMMLSGCGTLSRGDSIESTYRGFAQDKKVVSNPYMWMLSLGIMPIFYIASMPIDIAVDTVLYPVDLLIAKQPDRYKKIPVNVPFYAVNLTGGQDFTYTLKKNSTGEVLLKGKASKVPLSGVKDSIIDITVLASNNGPSATIEPIIIEWGVASPLSIVNNKPKEDKVLMFNSLLSPSYKVLSARSIIAFFMPCNKVVLFNTYDYYYNSNVTQEKVLLNYYNELNLLASKSQCLSATEINDKSKYIWKNTPVL